MNYLVCEGFNGGLDERVFDALIAQKLGVVVRTEPVGGDSIARGVASYLRGMHTGGKVMSVLDRNFSSRSEVRRNKTGSHRLLSRHEIENYLIDPRVVAAAFLKWAPGKLPSTEAEAADLLRKLAFSRIEHHVGQLTLRAIQRYKQSQVEHRVLRPGQPKSSGGNATSLSGVASRNDWLEFLHKEVIRLGEDCEHYHSLKRLECSRIVRLYDCLMRARREGNDFWSKSHFLVEMEGKELLAAVRRFVNTAGVNISKSDFESGLLESLSNAYVPGFFAHDDFVEIRDWFLDT